MDVLKFPTRNLSSHSMKRLLLIALSPLLFVLPAQSAIIYSGLQNIAIPTDFNGIYIDIDDASTSM